VIAERNFTGVPVERAQRAHGTHIASTIAGGGETHRGVAPDARLLDARVGAPVIGGCSDSAALVAVQWAVAQGAQIVNMSFGGDDTPEIDRYSREKGVLPEVEHVEVEVSFDDGATWRRTPVVEAEAIVRHDTGAGFASVRATVTDTAGGTGQMTVVRAYKIMI
jgi:hypothetical protein